MDQYCQRFQHPESFIMLRGPQGFLTKSFDTFLPLGPYIVSDLDPGDLTVSLRLNSGIRRRLSPGSLFFNTVVDKIEVEIEAIGTLANRVNSCF